MCIPTRTFLSFNNDKSWFTGKLKQLRQAKEDAYRSGDTILYNQVRNNLTKEIRVAKNIYSENLKKKNSCKQSGVSSPVGLVWGTSSARHLLHSLWRINNWLMIWMCFTADFRRPNLPPFHQQEPGASSEPVLLPVLSCFDWRAL